MGLPCCSMLTVPALASAFACFSGVHVCPEGTGGRIHRALRVQGCHRHSHDQDEQRIRRSHHWSVLPRIVERVRRAASPNCQVGCRHSRNEQGGTPPPPRSRTEFSRWFAPLNGRSLSCVLHTPQSHRCRQPLTTQVAHRPDLNARFEREADNAGDAEPSSTSARYSMSAVTTGSMTSSWSSWKGETLAQRLPQGNGLTLNENS